MTATIIPALPAFDSAEWAVNEFESEILGGMNSSEEHYDLLRMTAIQYVAGKLATHWLDQDRPVTLVSADAYARGTWNDEAINVTASSHYLPGVEEALALWQSIADSVTSDEIRQFAGLA